MKVHRVLVGLALATCTGCDGGIWVNAKVVDPNGSPIPNASAQLSFHDYQDKFSDSSSNAGCVSLGGVIAPMTEQWELEIEANGYKPLRTKVVSAERHTLKVTLQPVNSTDSSQYQAVSNNDGCAF